MYLISTAVTEQQGGRDRCAADCTAYEEIHLLSTILIMAPILVDNSENRHTLNLALTIILAHTHTILATLLHALHALLGATSNRATAPRIMACVRDLSD